MKYSNRFWTLGLLAGLVACGGNDPSEDEPRNELNDLDNEITDDDGDNSRSHEDGDGDDEDSSNNDSSNNDSGNNDSGNNDSGNNDEPRTITPQNVFDTVLWNYANHYLNKLNAKYTDEAQEVQTQQLGPFDLIPSPGSLVTKIQNVYQGQTQLMSQLNATDKNITQQQSDQGHNACLAALSSWDLDEFELLDLDVNLLWSLPDECTAYLALVGIQPEAGQTPPSIADDGSGDD